MFVKRCSPLAALFTHKKKTLISIHSLLFPEVVPLKRARAPVVFNPSRCVDLLKQTQYERLGRTSMWPPYYDRQNQQRSAR